MDDAMLRSVIAVVVRYLVMAVVVIVSTAFASKVMLGATPGHPKPPTRSYIAANLIFSALSAVLGGFLAAWIGRR